MTMNISDEFVQKVAGKALTYQIERSVKRQVEQIVDELLGCLLGNVRSKRKLKAGKSITNRLPDLKSFLRAQLQEACLGWIKEVMGEELGTPLLEHVMQQCELGDFDEDEGEEEEEEEEW